MRNAWVPAVIAAMLGFASIGAYAEEVKLTDQDRVEMRQRADSMRDGNANRLQNRSIGNSARHSTGSAATPVKAQHSKKHMKKQQRRDHSRPHA